jgi:hypothetical protein
MEYEFTVFMDIASNHIASSTKDRTTLFDGQYFKPSQQTGKVLMEWLEQRRKHRQHAKYAGGNARIRRRETGHSKGWEWFNKAHHKMA